jgi:hypothetical protein
MTCAATPRRWGTSEHDALCFPDNIRALIAALEGAERERDEAQQQLSITKDALKSGRCEFFCPHLREGRKVGGRSAGPMARAIAM